MQNHFFSEVGIDDVLFHLDAVLPQRFSKDQKFSRYISSDLSLIVDFLTTRHPTESRVTLQSGLVDGKEYSMRSVSKISCGSRKDGLLFFVCHCGDEKLVVGAADDVTSLEQTKVIWPRQSSLSWESLGS